MVWQLNQQISTQDSIIILYKAKEENYTSQIDNYKKIVIKKDEIITGLEKDVTKLTHQNKNLKTGVKWLGGGFVASLIAVITLIAIN